MRWCGEIIYTVWGNEMVWGDHIVLGNEMVWGDHIVLVNEVVWGDHINMGGMTWCGEIT